MLKIQTITFITSESLSQLDAASSSALVYVTSDSKILVLEEFDVEEAMKASESLKPLVCTPLSHLISQGTCSFRLYKARNFR